MFALFRVKLILIESNVRYPQPHKLIDPIRCTLDSLKNVLIQSLSLNSFRLCMISNTFERRPERVKNIIKLVDLSLGKTVVLIRKVKVHLSIYCLVFVQ